MAAGVSTSIQITLMSTCTKTSPEQMTSCDRGEMKLGRFVVRFDAAKMRAMRFVFVSRAPYTTEKPVPMQNSCTAHAKAVGRTCRDKYKSLSVSGHNL